MFRSLLLIFLALASQSLIAADAPWIEESNQNAEVLLEGLARYQPETAADLGVQGYDEAVMDLKPGVVQRQDRDLQTAIETLEQRRSKATDKRVQQDLDILIDAARDPRQTLPLTEQHLLPFFDLTQSIFGGFQNILDARVAKDRHAAALVRLRRYIGAEKGYEPIAKLARDRYEEAAQNTALLGPWNKEAQQY